MKVRLKNYILGLFILSADVIAIHQGGSKLSLVDGVVDYLEDENYDEVWCVFDMDYEPDMNHQYEDFDNAIQSAHKAGYKCAYSNDAFELWFILHYQFIDQEQVRTFFFKTLSNYWDINYEKSGKKRLFALSIYGRLSDDVGKTKILLLKIQISYWRVKSKKSITFKIL